jgi:DNA recombination protein RmuC
MEIVFALLVVLSALAGFALAWKLSGVAAVRTDLAQSRAAMEEARANSLALQSDLASARTSETMLRSQLAEQHQRAREQEAQLEELRNLLLEARSAEADLAARLEAESRNSKEKVAMLADAEAKLADAFAALSSASLKANNEAFLQLAQETLGRFHQDARTDLEHRQNSIRETLEPVRDSLARVNQRVTEIAASQGDLKKETSNLVRALRTPHVRGRWGEVQLKRVVELAGMVERCDFFEQQTISGADGQLRPDLIIRLPHGRSLVVDAKVPLSAYLDAFEMPDGPERQTKLKEHSVQVRTHIRQLARKSYWAGLESAPEFVVAFLPGEPFFSAALEQDPELLEFGVDQGVVLATPTTLIALLKSASYGWRQLELARNAEEISKLGSEIYGRLAKFAATYAKVGANIGKLVDTYNDSVGTLEARVLPAARKMREKGIAATSELGEVAGVDRIPRQLHVSELLDGPRN